MNNYLMIHGWYCQPIHCPFCGTPLLPEEEKGCKHLLYIIFNEFFIRTERFERASKKHFELKDGDTQLSIEEKKKYGAAHAIADKVLKEEFPNAVIFGVVEPSTVVDICFSPFDEELCYWRNESQSPYGEESEGQS